MNTCWRDLRVGDRVTIIDWPIEYPRERLHPETQELYEWLIGSGTPLEIVEINRDAFPVGRVDRNSDGELMVEYLTLDHGGLQLLSK